jgi:hypothetical protein
MAYNKNFIKVIKSSLCLIRHRAKRLQGTVETQLPKYLTKALGGSGQSHKFAVSHPGKEAPYLQDRRLGRPHSMDAMVK